MAVGSLTFRSTGAALEPVDSSSRAALAAMEPGEYVNVQLRRPRNGAAHRRFMAILTKVAQATEYETAERLLMVLKIALGRFDWVKMPDGSLVRAPHSISFTAMDQDEFARFAQDAELMIASEILPEGIDMDELIRGDVPQSREAA